MQTPSKLWNCDGKGDIKNKRKPSHRKWKHILKNNYKCNKIINQKQAIVAYIQSLYYRSKDIK